VRAGLSAGRPRHHLIDNSYELGLPLQLYQIHIQRVVGRLRGRSSSSSAVSQANALISLNALLRRGVIEIAERAKHRSACGQAWFEIFRESIPIRANFQV
jgi:hypothetical protein